MDFDSNFAVIQAILRNQEKVHGYLRNIQSGDESKVNSVKTKLLEAVKEESMTEDDLRRVYLLLLLNTDDDCFNDLYNEPNCAHILGSIPKLSKYLLINIVSHLNLDEFLYESILFLPPALSIKVVEIYFILLKTRDPFQLLKYVDFISRAIFIKLILLDESNSDDNFKIKLKYFEYLQLVLENLNSPKNDDYKSWEQNKLFYFTACIMKAVTSVVKTGCKYFIQPLYNKESYHEIYDIDFNKEFSIDVKIQPDLSDNDIVKKCLSLILSKFLTSAQSVTIYTWMAWLELDEYTDENLQSVIGNEVYYCLGYIKEEKVKCCINSHLYSELIAVLTNLSIKPINEDDEIKVADYQTILSSINDPIKSHAKWLSALISHDDFVPDTVSLIVIQEKVHLLNQKDCEIVFDKCVEYLKKFSRNVDKNIENDAGMKNGNLFKEIVLTSLKNFHVDNQLIVLETFIKKHGLIDLLTLPDFESQVTELFNKFIDEENQTFVFYSDFIRVCFQSPETVLRKTLKEALSSTKHGKLMVDLLKVLKSVCLFKKEGANSSTLHLIISDMMLNIETFSDTEKDNFVALVTRLINKSLIDGNEFLVNCLMPLLHRSVQDQKWCLIILLLNLLKSYTDGLVTFEDLELKMPIHLIFLGQLMDKTRCTISNYSAQSNAVCDKALEVLTTVIESFDVDEQEIAAMDWMKHELQKLNIITQMHVLSYINIPSLSEHISKTSIEVYWLKLILCGTETDLSFLYDMRRDFFLRTLSKLLPGFTTREWKIMFTNLVPKEEPESLHALFIAAADAVLFLEAAVIPHITELNTNDDNVSTDKTSQVISISATACLSFIIKNLITIVQDTIFPYAKKMTKEQVAEIFIKICYVLHEFPQAAQNYTSWILLKVLQDLISLASFPKSSDDKKSNVVEINKFCAGIGLIPNIELRQNLSKAIMSSIANTETVV